MPACLFASGIKLVVPRLSTARSTLASDAGLPRTAVSLVDLRSLHVHLRYVTLLLVFV